VDLSANTTPTFLNNAPLYGITALNQPASALPNGATGIPLSQSGTNLANGLSQRDILRLRSEMAQNVLSPTAAAQLTNGISSTTANGAAAAQPAGAPVLGQISGPISLGTSANVTGKAAVESGQIVVPQGDAATGQSVHQYIPLPPPPAEQSPQYAKLRELLQQYQSSHPKTDEEASRLFQQALQARREYEQNLTKAPLPVKPAENGQTAPKETTPTQTPQETEPTTPPPPPLEVGSIGEGIRAAGLSQLVQQGEDLARHQHFKDAINKLMEARQVAPNNMLIDVDLANAELGAGFYTEAESYLRESFTSDPALLMGRYDLKTEIGDDRLQAIITDLKQLAAGGDSATPVFLLAYLSYNTGDTDKAVEYLHLAQTRAGGQDDVIRSLGEHWSLPATQPSK
jgi:tetratricopeptide (TPR) repeat protein